MLSFLLFYMNDVDLKIMLKNLNNALIQRFMYTVITKVGLRVLVICAIYMFCIKHLVYNVQIRIYCKATVNGDTVMTYNADFHKITQLIERHSKALQFTLAYNFRHEI
jgi:hypothetical protein